MNGGWAMGEYESGAAPALATAGQTGMRLTVLGASPACQNPGGACSGYLLEQDGTSVLIDCGSGVFGRLQEALDPESLDAILITHTHADHTLDLIQFRYFLFFQRERGLNPRRPALYLPPGGHERLLALSGLQDPSPTFFSEHFAIAEYQQYMPLIVGPLTIGFVPVRHIPHTYAIDVRGSARFAFSADSGPCPELAQVARGSDLFLCEAANQESSEYPLHLTPRQAGAIAQEAGVGQLLLTHRWYAYGQESAVAEAREVYAGPVSLACEGMRLAIAPGTASHADPPSTKPIISSNNPTMPPVIAIDCP